MVAKLGLVITCSNGELLCEVYFFFSLQSSPSFVVVVTKLWSPTLEVHVIAAEKFDHMQMSLVQDKTAL